MVEVSDAAYMDAVERGDMKTAQRMVDAAAKKSGYITKGFHRTAKTFTKFIPGGPGGKSQVWRTKSGEMRTLFGPSGRAMWFGSSPDNLPAYHNDPTGKGMVLKAILKNPNPLQIDDDTRDWARDIYADGSKEFPLLLSDEHIRNIRGDGYTGIEYWRKGKTAEKSSPDEMVVFNPSQIKSADPVTYDDKGNVIPLSQRFNNQSEDIRNPKRKLKRGLRKNPVVFPADDITFAAASPTPANVAIAAGKTLWDIPAFKKWFGDSKVRDLAKRPMVVYHGTCSAEFTEFDPTKTQEVGFHFGTSPQAKDFLKGCGSSRGKTPGIYPVYLSIQNPIFTPDVYSEDPIYLIQWLEKTNHIHEWFPDESDSYYRSMNRLRDQMASLKSDSTLSGKEQYEMLKPLRKATSGLLRKVIMRKGYDGIRYKNENEGRTDDPTNIAWIAFSPAQVKSATENIRTFDRRDPDIRNPRRSMIRTKLSRILEPGDRVLDYDRAQGEDLYRLWDMVHTDKPLTKEALVEIEGMLDDDGVLVIQSGEEPSGLKDHFRRATRYQGMLLVQGPMNPEEARINTEKLRRDLE